MDAADILNYVGNQPEVISELLPGFESFDYSVFWTNPANLFYGDERGVVLFFDKGDGAYEIHFMLTDRLRGAAGLKFIRECLADVFTRHAACVIYGATPRENRTCRAVARALGARPAGETTDSFGRTCLIYVMERALWATSLAPCLEQTHPNKLAKMRQSMI